MTTRRALLRTALTASSLAALGTLLAACGTDTTGSPTPITSATLDPEAAELLASYDIAATTAEEAVTALDQVSEPRPLTVTGSVGYDQVTLAGNSTEVTVPLTGGQFYLSVAPYRTQTHECFYHNLGGCQGELIETPVHVAVTTTAGETLVDQRTSTYTNGFVGFWIPRDLTGTVTLTADGDIATSPFDSGPEGPTCLTMLHLT